MLPRATSQTGAADMNYPHVAAVCCVLLRVGVGGWALSQEFALVHSAEEPA